jgi:protein-S-isoprenylcysteine O-methyltransferase Ste14
MIPDDVGVLILRVLLPLYGITVVAAIAVHRSRVSKITGRNPIVVRPFSRNDSPLGYLESALSVCSLLLALDLILNAVSPEAVGEQLAIPVLRTSAFLKYVGFGLVTGGLLLSGAAVRHMGASWRIGVDHQQPGPLVTRGVFRRMRHPIYAGMLLTTWGMAAATADMLSLTVAAAAVVGIPLQARLEEEFLASLNPEQYKSYKATTNRFWPRRTR